jgi:hypothetical protein
MSLELDNALHWLLIATIVALVFFLARLAGGAMVGGPLDTIGNAILNIYP